MPSVVPAVIDALVTQARAALSTVEVHDGFGVTDDPGDYLSIGVEDSEARGFEVAADSTQEWTFANTTSRTQEGDITCLALSWNGDADMKAARDAAYATTAAVEALLRADPSLGLVPGTSSFLIAGFGGRETLSQGQTDNGAEARVAFTVRFTARI